MWGEEKTQFRLESSKCPKIAVLRMESEAQMRETKKVVLTILKLEKSPNF